MNDVEILKEIDSAINSSTGKDDYIVGFRNGLKYVKSVITSKEPIYDECLEKWHKKEPPKKSGEYLVRTKNKYIVVGRYLTGFGWNGRLKNCVIGWMELPKYDDVEDSDVIL